MLSAFGDGVGHIWVDLSRPYVTRMGFQLPGRRGRIVAHRRGAARRRGGWQSPRLEVIVGRREADESVEGDPVPRLLAFLLRVDPEFTARLEIRRDNGRC